jgi:hypothetical protein
MLDFRFFDSKCFNVWNLGFRKLEVVGVWVLGTRKVLGFCGALKVLGFCVF